jgi:hypothetical protein
MYSKRHAARTEENVGKPLREGEGGPDGSLANRPLPEGLALVFMPSLAELLARAEQLKGAALTEEQVVKVMHAASAVVTKENVAEAVIKERGYAEVDPGKPWETPTPFTANSLAWLATPPPAQRPAVMRSRGLPCA